MEISIYGEESAATLSKALPKDVVYMCIGTSAVVADSLGLWWEAFFKETWQNPFSVYGFCASNITALNIYAAYEVIKLFHPDRKVMVIDAAVGEEGEKGKIIYNSFPLIPGAATKKNLCAIGDYSIMGVVAQRGLSDFYDTAAEKKLLVSQMAEVIASAIYKSAQD